MTNIENQHKEILDRLDARLEGQLLPTLDEAAERIMKEWKAQKENNN